VSSNPATMATARKSRDVVIVPPIQPSLRLQKINQANT
jgi:hypothetical protein